MQRVHAPGRTELHQSRSSVLALPGLIAVCLVAIVVRQFIGQPPSPTTLIVCGVAALLDVPIAIFCWRNGAASLIVTPTDITFVRQGTRDKPATTLSLARAADSKLRFRLQSNGFVGGQPQYLLKLHDDGTGNELPVTTFGRRPVRQACEAQGWQFA